MACVRKTLVLLVPASLLLLLPLVWGCGKGGQPLAGSPEEQARQEELTDFYEMYEYHVKNTGGPPKQPSDLLTKENEIAHPAGYRALKSETVGVVWGVDPKDSGKVLAYEKASLDKGGAVLMADGKVKKMSADDLRAAVKK